MIKKITLGMAALSALSFVALAGPPEPAPVDKNPVPPQCPSYYADQEFSVQIFGLGAWRAGSDAGNGVYLPGGHRIGGHDAFGGEGRAGGGGEVQYFFTRNLGVGIEGYGLDLNEGAGGVAGNLYLRAPLNPCSRWAPYLFGGVGGLFASEPTVYVSSYTFNGNTYGGKSYGGGSADRFEGHLGGGIEVRFTQHIGAFVDGRYVFVSGNNDRVPKYGEVRGGFKYAF